MCRFLLFKSINPQNPQKTIKAFCRMAKNSRAFDGDRQKDGWGISWFENDIWKSYRSVKPIWEDQEMDTLSFASTMFLIHARSASFALHKNNLDYNQPFFNTTNAFVFNGLVKGVSLSLPGAIGSQKIWSLVQKKLLSMPPEKALENTLEELIQNSQTVQALNIGIADKKNIYALCYYSKHPDYYSLFFSKTDEYGIVSSEPIEGFNFNPLSKGDVVKL